MDAWNSYFIEGTNVFKNKLGITDSDLLKQKEDEIVLYKLSYLILNGMNGNFDSKHLCDIHRFLFSDIYYFAGEYRIVEMYKKTGFTKPENIPLELESFLNYMNSKEINSNIKFDLARHLAECYSRLMDIHPFREGNGRTVREFIRQYVAFKFPNYEVDYSRMTPKHFYDAIEYPNIYPNLIFNEFYEGLVLKELEKTK